ncbi:MAG: hypothetical protein IPJ77_14150 [Planctomycetes bacterium]|nr:hypothetical protein [Planctomycetota bacterium]
MHRILSCGASMLALALTPVASANTWVVDAANGPGSQFDEIGVAIAAAAPGDLILVRAGSYSPFVLDKGLTILADAGTDVPGTVTVQNVASVRAIVAGLDCDGLVVSNCARVVLLQGLTVRGLSGGWTSAAVEIDSSIDVRLQSVTVPGGATTLPSTSGQSAVRVNGARVELVRCDLRGRDGRPTFNQSSSLFRPNGGDGLVVDTGANVHVALSSVRGGRGGDAGGTPGIPFYGGDGGEGVRLAGTGPRLLLSGTAADLVLGGDSGLGADDLCLDSGFPGNGIDASHASSPVARASGATLQGGYDLCRDSTAFSTMGAVTLPSVADPALEMLPPIASPGQSVTFVVHAAPGTDVRLRLGRRTIVEDLATTEEDRLVEQLRSWGLGVVPASGEVTFPFTMPSTSPVGALLATQAVSVDTLGGAALTASWPIVLR